MAGAPVGGADDYVSGTIRVRVNVRKSVRSPSASGGWYSNCLLYTSPSPRD